MSKEISTRAERRLHLGAILSGVGTADTVANEIERWFRQGACDGFNYRVGNPVDFALFIERVVPILQHRGLFRTEYEGSTLRSHSDCRSRPTIMRSRYAKPPNSGQAGRPTIKAQQNSISYKENSVSKRYRCLDSCATLKSRTASS
jgi:hypothetical protein